MGPYAVKAGLLAGLVAGLATGCSCEPPQAVPLPALTASPAAAGKVEPAPESEHALGRAVLDALARDDWEGYTNLLATRGDMMGLYKDVDRRDDLERRKRRRMVWRRINRLRDGEAEEGWKVTRRKAALDGVAWDAARLVDVRRGEVAVERLAPGTEAAELTLVIEHGGVELELGLGACVRAKRGWVALYPLAWHGTVAREP